MRVRARARVKSTPNPNLGRREGLLQRLHVSTEGDPLEAVHAQRLRLVRIRATLAAVAAAGRAAEVREESAERLVPCVQKVVHLCKGVQPQ